MKRARDLCRQKMMIFLDVCTTKKTKVVKLNGPAYQVSIVFIVPIRVQTVESIMDTTFYLTAHEYIRSQLGCVNGTISLRHVKGRLRATRIVP